MWALQHKLYCTTWVAMNIGLNTIKNSSTGICRGHYTATHHPHCMNNTITIDTGATIQINFSNQLYTSYMLITHVLCSTHAQHTLASLWSEEFHVGHSMCLRVWYSCICPYILLTSAQRYIHHLRWSWCSPLLLQYSNDIN